MRKSSSSYQQQPPSLQPGQGGYAPPPFKQQLQQPQPQRISYSQPQQAPSFSYQKTQQPPPLKQQQQQQYGLRVSNNGGYTTPQMKGYRNMGMTPGGPIPMNFVPNNKQGPFIQKGQAGLPTVQFNPQKFQYTPRQQQELMGKAMSQKIVPGTKGFDRAIPSNKNNNNKGYIHQHNTHIFIYSHFLIFSIDLCLLSHLFLILFFFPIHILKLVSFFM